jgi:hypothetical protein
MPDLSAPDSELARFLVERGLAVLYVIAFAVAIRQFPPLAGERGLEPAPRFLAATTFWQAPTLFRWRYSDRLLVGLSSLGLLVAVTLALGIPQGLSLPLTMVAWFVLWVAYLSIVNVGGTFYGFGWESLLLEAGFLAIFLGSADVPPQLPVLILFLWLAFRVEFGAGLIKLRGDPCWRDLSCMDYHHETQPLPSPTSRFFHGLPRGYHRFEAFGNFVAQLILPFGLFLPQPVATIAALLMIGTQLYLVGSGNYAWLNWVTVIVLAAAIGDPVVAAVAPGLVPASTFATAPWWFTVAVLGLAVVVAVLSWFPVRNMLSPNQAMNASFDPFRLVNTYGAFGSVSRRRFEVIVEGTADDPRSRTADWHEYEFKAKPGDVRRRPPQVAPYHLRLDWLMWFLPLSPRYGERWFLPFLIRLLEGDPATLRLMGRNPFPDGPPRFIRALLYEYRFADADERRATGAWWSRELVGEFVGPVALRADGRLEG